MQLSIPNFLIVGAPKCGTTAMWRYLNAHPEIHLSPKKDMHYFGKDYAPLKRPRFSLEEYLSHFDHTDQRAIGEASVWYLHSRFAAQEIFDFNPDMKIIVMLRDPVQMIYAHYTQMRFNALGDEDLTTFEEALSAEPDRRSGHRIPKHCTLASALLYRDIAQLADQLDRYYAVFPKEQVLVLFQEDMKTQVEALYRRTLEFLQVNPDFQTDFKRINTHKEVRYEGIRKLIGITPVGVKDLVPAGLRSRMSKGIKRLNSKHAERKPLNAETERLLRTEFDEQIVKLSGLTGRNLDHWRVDTE
ncbi:MAG: sulfotransferase family protein [Myxococcota bacterium]